MSVHEQHELMSAYEMLDPIYFLSEKNDGHLAS